MMGQEQKEGHQGRAPQVPNKEENKDLAPRVAIPPLAYRWSCGLDPLTFHITGHMV